MLDAGGWAELQEVKTIPEFIADVLAELPSHQRAVAQDCIAACDTIPDDDSVIAECMMTALRNAGCDMDSVPLLSAAATAAMCCLAQRAGSHDAAVLTVAALDMAYTLAGECINAATEHKMHDVATVDIVKACNSEAQRLDLMAGIVSYAAELAEERDTGGYDNVCATWARCLRMRARELREEE